jgi:AcrR family transcriptional regulator
MILDPHDANDERERALAIRLGQSLRALRRPTGDDADETSTVAAMAPSGRRRPAARAGTSAAAGEETREKILDAALATLTAEGFLGTTARSIARTGGFNQALVFYHFGSVDEVLVASVERMSERRLAVYRERVAQAADLPAIVAVAREVLGEDMAGGAITVLAQMVAGAHGRAHLGTRLARVWDPWIDVVESAVLRVVEGTGFEGVIPAHDLAFALTGMFLGVELLSQLDPDNGQMEALFTSIDTMATLLQGVFAMLQAASTG